MRKMYYDHRVLMLLVCLLLTACLPAQVSRQWVATYGQGRGDFATDAVPTADGGVVVAAAIEDAETGKESISLRKFSATGVEEFAHLLRDSRRDIPPYGLEVRPDGTMITGSKFGGGALIVSVNPDGSINKSELDQSYTLWDITTGRDGLLVACGSGPSNTAIRAYNDSLELIWENDIEVDLVRDAVSVAALADGGYALLCAASPRRGDVAVIRTDNRGQVIWSRIYGGSEEEFVDVNNDPGPNIMQGPDGNLVFGASTRSSDGDVTFADGENSRDRYWAVKLDLVTGDVIWNNVLARGFCNGINIKLDGTVLVYGRGVGGDANNVPSNVPADALGSRSSENWIGSISADGEVEYSYHFVSDEPHAINQVVNYPDGTWLAVGRTRSEEPPFTNQGGFDVLVMRFDDGTEPGGMPGGGLSRLDTMVCPGDSLVIAGEVFNADRPTGNITLEGQAADGGDSTIMISVTFFDTAVGQFMAEACPGTTVEVAGRSFPAESVPDTIMLRGAAATGCDSIVELAVTLLDADAAACGGTNPGNGDFECLPTSNPICLSQERTSLGGQACVDFGANNFTNIIGMQFSVEFDATQLTFDSIKTTAALPELDPALNFSFERSDEGIITFSYNLLTGETLTLDDGVSLFQLCFTGQTGGLAPVTVTDTVLGQTTILYGDLSEQPYAGNAGSVEVIQCTDTIVMIDTLICLGETVTFDNTTIADAGTYTAVGMSAGGCDSTTILTVSINEVEFAFPENIGFCPGDPRVVSGPDSVLIGLAATADDMLSANLILPLGTSVVKIREIGSGCVRTQEVMVFEFTPPAVTVNGERSYCADESGTSLTAEGAENFLWSTGDTTATVFLTAGEYTVTGTDANGCETTVAVSVETLPLPDLTLTGELTYCAGTDGTVVNVNGAQTYSFSNGASGATATLTAGDYVVTGVGANGCSDTLAFTITELPLPEVVITGDTVYCAGGDGVTLTASGGETYSWSNGATEATINVQVGMYTVTATDANGCSATAEVTVRELPLPEISFEGETAYCAEEAGATITASGGLTYVWSTEAETATVTLTAGTYTVTATDDNGCSAVAEVTITENPLPEVRILGDLNVCPDEEGTILTALGGSSYLWSTGATTASVVAPAGDYSVTVTDVNGCRNSASVTVVGDTIAPVVLACPADRSAVLNFGQTEIAVSWPEPFAEDNCGMPMLSGPIGGGNGDLYPEGTTTITYPAEDVAGNRSSCTFNVNVRRSDALTFYVDSAGTTFENGVACIPVRVRAFRSVVTFGVAFSLPDLPGVEYITTVPAPEVAASAGEDFFSVQENPNGEIAIVYLNNAGTGLSLEDESIAFTLKAALPGAPGDCFSIGTVLDLLNVEALQAGIGETVPTLIPAVVCLPKLFNVTGRTYRPNADRSPIPAADIELESSDNSDDLDITDLAGRYGFEELDGGLMHTFTPERDFEHNRGLSVTDLGFMIFHIRGIQFLTDPYQIIAANVNDDDRISLLDIAPVQQVILGTSGEFLENKSWRFLPVSYMIDPMAPINEYEESVTLPNLDQDEVVDFFGVKIGDLNNSPVNLQGDGESETARFIARERYVTAGETVRVPIRYAEGQPQLVGYQQSWKYDTRALALVSASAGNKGKENLTVSADRKAGTLRALYLDRNPEAGQLFQKSVSDEVLAMTFEVRTSGWLSDFLYLDDAAEMPSLTAAGMPLREATVDIVFAGQENRGTLAVSVTPNPVRDRASITLSVSQPGKWYLEMIDMRGRLIGESTGTTVAAGAIQADLPMPTGRLSPGTYYLRLRTEAGSVTTSLIKQ